MHGSSFEFLPEIFSVTSMAERRADAASPRHDVKRPAPPKVAHCPLLLPAVSAACFRLLCPLARVSAEA
jgi:hypothetical protein